MTDRQPESGSRERSPVIIVALIAAVLVLLDGWTLLYTLLFFISPDSLGGKCPVDCFVSGVVLLPATVVPLAVGTLLGIDAIRDLRRRALRRPGPAADGRPSTAQSSRTGLGWSPGERAMPGSGTWLALAAAALLLLVNVPIALAAFIGLISVVGVRSAGGRRGSADGRMLDGPAGPVIVGRAPHGEEPAGPLGAGWASWAPRRATASAWDTRMVEVLALMGVLFCGAWLLMGLWLRVAPPVEYDGATVILPWEPVVYGLALAGSIAVFVLVQLEVARRRTKRQESD